MLAKARQPLAALAVLAFCALRPGSAANDGLRFPRAHMASASAELCFHQGRNVTGQCRVLTSCPSALRELRNNMYPQVCGFTGRQPNVCCPMEDADNRVMQQPTPPPRPAGAQAESEPSPVNCRLQLQQLQKQKQQAGSNRRHRPGDVARQKCRDYVQYVCQEVPSPALMLGGTDVTDRCHYHVELISGGKQVDPKEFPHMALLGYGAENQVDYTCGGSLIAPDFVLTAAHCVSSRSSGLQVGWALLGALDRTAAPHRNAAPQLLQVKEAIVHPNYRKEQQYHDIALLRLRRPAAIDDYVRPACLHTDTDGDPLGMNAIATGWGARGIAEDQSEHLYKVNLPVIPTERCRSAIGAVNASAAGMNAKLARGLIDSQLCAGGAGQSDTCPGDSGGPLQMPTNVDPYCQYKVVGVVSFGPACGLGLPGVYTRVAAYVPWIESVVWPRED